jgi:alpha-tubulin suppressor-like RCC1 family protein
MATSIETNETPHTRTAEHSRRAVACAVLVGVAVLGAALTSITARPAGAALVARPAIVAGDSHTCALAAAGTVQCWGDNSLGQLGTGSFADRYVAAPVPGLGGVSQVSAGWAHTCALRTTGTVDCWGMNSSGQLGDGTTTTRLVPTPVVGLSGVSAIAAGDYNTCALLAGGSVKCWGDNRYGAVGNGNTSQFVATPTSVTGVSNATAITTGLYFACARLDDATATCWGSNGYGKLGDGTTVDRYTATPVAGLADVVAIDAGQMHTCAVRAGGSLVCWGTNNRGQLGNDAVQSSALPIVVAGVSGATAVSSGTFHTCVRLAASTLQCWGENTGGSLGDGTDVRRNYPVSVVGISTATDVVASIWHSCALLADGSARCWGNNASGFLGDGTRTARHLPTIVVGLNVRDLTPPNVAMTAPSSSVTLSMSVAARWSGSDPSGVARYDVRRSITPWNAPMSPWTEWLTGTRATSASLTGSYGRTYCVSARAEDGSGNLGAWSNTRCTSVPLRSDHLSRSSGWTKSTSSAYFGGLAHISKTRNTTMTRTGVVAKKLYLVATKCATCGTVQVRWNNNVVTTLNLYRSTTARQQIIPIVTWPTAHTGSMQLIVTSATGKSVIIEGLAAYNS